MQPKAGLFKKLRYWLDNMFSQGSGPLIFWLGVLTLAIILISTLVLTLTGLAPGGEGQYNFPEAFWASLLRTLGSGTIGGRDTAWGFRLLMLSVTLASLFVFSTLISLLTNSMRARLDELRKGRSQVIESGHTVLLGWSEQIFTIVPELVLANGPARACIVVLAGQDKVFMEDQLRRRVGKTGRTRLVCRTGSPLEMADLEIASLNTARNIIVLSPESDHPDVDVIKTVLAITKHPQRRKELYHIVAALRQPRNKQVAALVGKDEVEWVQAGEVISKMVAQTSRQSGLSIIYTQLLDFRGHEIYFHKAPALVGKTYADALLASVQDTVIGIGTHDQVSLNPPGEQIIQESDELIIIAKDDHLINLPAGQATIQPQDISRRQPRPSQPEHILILGWNWRGETVVRDLDAYVAPGSSVLVVADQAAVEQAIAGDCQNLKNLEVCFQIGDTTDRAVLERLDLPRYEHVVILCYVDRFTTQRADAYTFMTLLHLRDLADLHGYTYSIVSEILDVRNRKLAAETRADDFIVSDRFVSLMMAQVAERKQLNRVWAELFSPEGMEIYLKPAGDYVHLGAPVDVATLIKAAHCRGETALGYRLASRANQAEHLFGVEINPRKDKEVTFEARDQVIVLATE